MRDSWFSSQVIRVRLERTTNGLKDHCYDVLISDNIGLTGTELRLCPSNVCASYIRTPPPSFQVGG